ncbi:MAG: hypothetical protein COV57_03165 [Candidatus Liptonbacteria bacterium CG11_big_fil_rev_8_21_14_0_20_35_14]|uniref:Serine protease n=1 Tax=Candidatus Liptonbacteria bacterium CG11_big_fil_rev_8_21_14_0_20_35_14 TaxID=1974634 RepID=A0A2H0N9B1_9BACT|nr:MAG: hypothetical protein COV57_03165 [Candidatus Liptonbacteria bacterium CG11_big_fil_rev_8_21_14_0_20_35_14]
MLVKQNKSLLIFIFFFAGQLWSQEKMPAYGDEKAIIASKTKAVVKIETTMTNGDQEVGSGSYLGDGVIVTNFHVMKPYLEGKVKTLRVLDWRGGAAIKVSIGNCGGENQNIDLCTLKVEGLDLHYPFKLMSKVFKSNYKVNGYGYCASGGGLRGFSGPVLEFIDGMGEHMGIYGSKKLDVKSKAYKIGFTNCKGSSGGPIFDPVSGELIAIFTRYYFTQTSGNKSFEELKEVSTFSANSSIQILELVKDNSNFREISSEKINKERKLASPYEVIPH